MIGCRLPSGKLRPQSETGADVASAPHLPGRLGCGPRKGNCYRAGGARPGTGRSAMARPAGRTGPASAFRALDGPLGRRRALGPQLSAQKAAQAEIFCRQAGKLVLGGGDRRGKLGFPVLRG
jgi:hypothetical protein